MPAETVAHWLGVACRDLREGAGRMQVHIAAEANVDQSTIVRFEAGKGRGFPRDLDELLSAYARALDIHESEIWLLAIGQWRHADNAVHLDADELRALGRRLEVLMAEEFAALERAGSPSPRVIRGRGRGH